MLKIKHVPKTNGRTRIGQNECIFLDFIFYPIILNRSDKTGYKKNKFFHEKITYTIDESGIEWQGETMWEKKTWSEIEKIGFLDKLLLLSILNSVWTHYIPIDSLDEEELLRLKKILARVNINQVQL